MTHVFVDLLEVLGQLRPLEDEAEGRGLLLLRLRSHLLLGVGHDLGFVVEVAAAAEARKSKMSANSKESPRRHDLVVRAVACDARGPGFVSSSDQMVFLLRHNEVGKKDPDKIKLRDRAYP